MPRDVLPYREGRGGGLEGEGLWGGGGQGGRERGEEAAGQNLMLHNVGLKHVHTAATGELHVGAAEDAVSTLHPYIVG